MGKCWRQSAGTEAVSEYPPDVNGMRVFGDKMFNPLEACTYACF